MARRGLKRSHGTFWPSLCTLDFVHCTCPKSTVKPFEASRMVIASGGPMAAVCFREGGLIGKLDEVVAAARAFGDPADFALQLFRREGFADVEVDAFGAGF